MINYPVALLRDSAMEDRTDTLQAWHGSSLSLDSLSLAEFNILADWQRSDIPYLLAVPDNNLQLIPQNRKLAPLVVDFESGTMGYRGHQNVRNELVVKAVLGRDKQHLPTVIDATAGLGRDSFLLAVLGCEVALMERNPIVLALLADGLYRYQKSGEPDVAARLKLYAGNFAQEFIKLPNAEVVYLDPMFPQREKSAKVKKEMQIFKDIVGADVDSDALLQTAKNIAQKKVVVKRPSKAEHLNAEKPTYSLTGRSSRFDVYQIS